MKKLQKNEGFTLIELLIVVAIIGIIAAIAVPGLLRARMSGNETSAIGSMRAINTAQVNFSAACGQGAYAPTLPVLGTPPPMGNQGFISPDLSQVAAPQKSGYDVTMVAGGYAAGPGSCHAGGPTIVGYYATTDPINFTSTGNRSFATNHSGTIFFNTTAAPPTQADIESTPPGATAQILQ